MKYLFLILGLTLALYWRVTTYDYSYYDDIRLLAERKTELQAPISLKYIFLTDAFNTDTVVKSYYRPVLNLSFALDAHRPIFSPKYYFITNLWLHLINCVLLWLLLQRVNIKLKARMLATSIFAFHPALTMAIAWIPGRNDSLLALFFLAATYFFLNKKHLLWHLLFFLAALFTKETALLFPVIWYLLFKKRLYPTWIIPVVLYLSLRFQVIPATAALTLTFPTFKALIASLGFLLAPFALPLLPTLATTSGFYYILGIISLPLLWIPALLLLPSVLVQPEPFLLQRLYLPLIVALLFLLPKLKTIKPYLYALPCLLFFLTHTFLPVFKNATTFWEYAYQKSPKSWQVLTNYAAIKVKAGDLSLAESALNQALTINPTAKYAHVNLAQIKEKQNKLSEAILWAKREVEINPSSETLAYLGTLHLKAGDLSQAKTVFYQALELNPTHQPSLRALQEIDSLGQ